MIHSLTCGVHTVILQYIYITIHFLYLDYLDEIHILSASISLFH